MTTETAINPPVSNAALWTGRVLSALPVLLMLMGIGYAATHQAAVKQDMAKYGFPEKTVIPILVVEAACVLLYVIPQTDVLGAILLTAYLGGATVTHVRARASLVHL